MGNRSKEGCDDVTDITLFNSDGDPLCWCGHDSVIELHQASTNTYWYCKKHWQEHQELYKKWLALYETPRTTVDTLDVSVSLEGD